MIDGYDLLHDIVDTLTECYHDLNVSNCIFALLCDIGDFFKYKSLAQLKAALLGSISSGIGGLVAGATAVVSAIEYAAVKSAEFTLSSAKAFYKLTSSTVSSFSSIKNLADVGKLMKSIYKNLGKGFKSIIDWVKSAPGIFIKHGDTLKAVSKEADEGLRALRGKFGKEFTDRILNLGSDVAESMGRIAKDNELGPNIVKKIFDYNDDDAGRV